MHFISRHTEGTERDLMSAERALRAKKRSTFYVTKTNADSTGRRTNMDRLRSVCDAGVVALVGQLLKIIMAEKTAEWNDDR